MNPQAPENPGPAAHPAPTPASLPRDPDRQPRSVLLVLLLAHRARGGAERYTRDLAQTLLSRGLRVATAALSFDPDWPGDHLPVGGRGGGDRSGGAGRSGGALSALTTLSRTARYNRFLKDVDRLVAARATNVAHITHAMLPVYRCDVYHPHAGVAALPKRSAPFDWLNCRRNRMARVERLMLQSHPPPLTLSLSNYSLSHLRQAHGPTPPSQVLLNGVDLSRFDPTALPDARDAQRRAWGLSPTDIVALCVAQDFARKGVPQAVRALARLKDLPLQLVVVGRDRPGPIRALAKRLGIHQRVHLVGPLPDPRPAYLAADLFLLPTSHDPCPLVTLEALAMGLPVVSTVFNGACEYMPPPSPPPSAPYSLYPGIERTCGLVLPSTDPEPLAAALRTALASGKLSAWRQALPALRPHLSADAHYDRLLGLYHAIVRSRVASAGEP